MTRILYHVFYEDSDDAVGLYIGSYETKERAEKIGNYAWKLFQNDGTDKSREILEELRFWKKYEISELAEYTHFAVKGIRLTSGITSLLIFTSGIPEFVQKYMEYRGIIQPELFPKEAYEDCKMYQHREKRLLAQKKAERKGKILQGIKNTICVNGFSQKMKRARFEISQLDSLIWKEIEVTQDFYNRLERSDIIEIFLNDENLKREIIDFDNYFRCNVKLKARIYNEVKNILYFDLEDVV